MGGGVPELMRRLPLLIVLGLAACGGAPEPGMTEFRGTFLGNFSILSPGDEGSLDRCDANATDGENPGFSLSAFDEATGEFSVLGPVSIVASNCTHPERGEFVQGRATVTGANGEEIRTEFRGSVRDTEDPDLNVGRGEHQIVGGTGRFADAEGWVVCDLRVRVSTSQETGTCHGEIIAPTSGRSP